MDRQSTTPEPFPLPIDMRQEWSEFRTIWPLSKWNFCVGLPEHVVSTAGTPAALEPLAASRHLPTKPTTSASGNVQVWFVAVRTPEQAPAWAGVPFQVAVPAD